MPFSLGLLGCELLGLMGSVFLVLRLFMLTYLQVTGNISRGSLTVVEQVTRHAAITCSFHFTQLYFPWKEDRYCKSLFCLSVVMASAEDTGCLKIFQPKSQGIHKYILENVVFTASHCSFTLCCFSLFKFSDWFVH